MSQLPKRWATQWANWAGVSPRAAQKWLRGTAPAPAWAVLVAVEKLVENFAVTNKAETALELLELLAARRAEHAHA